MYKRKDGFYRQAKLKGYRSRAAFKLKQLNQDYHLIKRGDRVVDLGCAPGGWMQVARELVGEEGYVLGIDMIPIENLEGKNMAFLQGDIREERVAESIREKLGGRADMVMSDLSPNLTGIRHADHHHSIQLSQDAFRLAKRVLKQKGNFLVKTFLGPDFGSFKKEIEAAFQTVKATRPEATRKASRELYLIGRGYQGQNQGGELSNL
ncbi:MAG: methyltransferase domain-containing protein [Deltaproteobacteria bacterium]|nr:MAG: methyltransferase domain-containing protein [Deltaproteobacteria bacterium]